MRVSFGGEIIIHHFLAADCGSADHMRGGCDARERMKKLLGTANYFLSSSSENAVSRFSWLGHEHFLLQSEREAECTPLTVGRNLSGSKMSPKVYSKYKLGPAGQSGLLSKWLYVQQLAKYRVWRDV